MAENYNKLSDKFNEIGNEIFKARKARNKSQTELEKMTGIDRSKISRIERGTENSFYVWELLKLAEALQVPAIVLLEGEEAMELADSKNLSIEERAHRFRLMEFDKKEFGRLMKTRKS